MPLGKFQSDVLRVLAAQRSPDSYSRVVSPLTAKALAFPATYIFHDSEARLEAAANTDAAALAAAGYASGGIAGIPIIFAKRNHNYRNYWSGGRVPCR